MQRILSYFAPQNSFIADRIRLGENFHEMKVFWTAFAPMSEGTEKFVENYLPIIRLLNSFFNLIFFKQISFRQNNPQVKFSLQRGYVSVDPWLIGMFDLFY